MADPMSVTKVRRSLGSKANKSNNKIDRVGRWCVGQPRRPLLRLFRGVDRTPARWIPLFRFRVQNYPIAVWLLGRYAALNLAEEEFRFGRFALNKSNVPEWLVVPKFLPSFLAWYKVFESATMVPPLLRLMDSDGGQGRAVAWIRARRSSNKSIVDTAGPAFGYGRRLSRSRGARIWMTSRTAHVYYNRPIGGRWDGES